MAYKNVSFRLNMDDIAENKLYERIMEESKEYASIATYMRTITEEYFNYKDIAKKEEDAILYRKEQEQIFCSDLLKLVEDTMRDEALKIVGSILAGMNSGGISASDEKSTYNDIPETGDLPNNITEAVLDYIG